MNFRIFCWNN